MAKKIIFFDLISIDRKSTCPCYIQVYSAIRDAVLAGRLKTGVRLPSTRALAKDLKLGRTTIVTAYEQLTAEGYITSASGSVTRIADISQTLPVFQRPENKMITSGSRKNRLSDRGKILVKEKRVLPEYKYSTFSIGLPDLSEFPHAIWARLLGRHARRASTFHYDFSHPAGLPELRYAIARHLGAVRGVRTDPEQVVVLNSAQAGLDIVARLTLDQGNKVWIEEPGYLGARGALVGAGAQVQAVPLDSDGISIKAGRADSSLPPKLIYVTPSHQCPTGITMSLQRRLSLLAYAKQVGAWILEDDYDSEFRYRGNPIASLQGLDQSDLVIYLGTFSKTLLPGLRVGYLVVPPALIEPVRTAIVQTGHTVAKVIQAALANFLDDGHFAAHLRRMRMLYSDRQDVLIHELEKQLPGVFTILPSDTGMQLGAVFTQALDDSLITAAARKENIIATPLTRYYIGENVQNGLYLGFGAVCRKDIRPGVMKLADAINNVIQH